MSTHRSFTRRRGRDGYTLVELMMGIALFTVGVLGVISMQKLTVVSNAHAKNMSIAQRVAQSWAAQLQLDTANWRTDMSTTSWLFTLSNAGGWQAPAYVAARSFGGAFDALGNPLADPADARARYCTNVRLTMLHPPNQAGVVGNGMMRAEIRVFWLRDGQQLPSANGVCTVTPAQLALDATPERYHWIYHTAGVRQRTNI